MCNVTMGKLFIINNSDITGKWHRYLFFLHCIFSTQKASDTKNATVQNVWSSSKTSSKALSQVHTTDVQNTTE